MSKIIQELWNFIDVYLISKQYTFMISKWLCPEFWEKFYKIFDIKITEPARQQPMVIQMACEWIKLCLDEIYSDCGHFNLWWSINFCLEETNFVSLPPTLQKNKMEWVVSSRWSLEISCDLSWNWTIIYFSWKIYWVH